VLNGARAISASRNKVRALQHLAAAGVRVPRTVMASAATGLREMARLVGGVPVLVKLLSADEKGGVVICETWESLEAALEAILGLGQNIVVQQYVHGAKGRDLRVLVVGGEVVAALRRRPAVGKLESSLRRSARFEQAELPAAHGRAAVAAAQVLGLEVCAVDLLDVRGKPLVFDVNSSPSIKEAETACGVDVAGRIVERAVALAGEAARPVPRLRPRARAALARRP
jgi:ribosomal protein S6--L-glutamate ligase